MSDERRVDVLLEQADRRMQMADHRGAIGHLREALALDPDHAQAHAMLALALLGAKRLPGAAIEARAALACDSGSPFCHYAAASVYAAQRKLDEAWNHCEMALAADTSHVEARVLGAWIRDLRGETADARALLRDALELEPNHIGALVRFARIEHAHDRPDEADRYAQEALRARPDSAAAHVVAGWIALVRGDAVAAEQHARFALNQDAADEDALKLWAAIKARRSWSLGVWWRFNAFVSLRSESSQLGVLMGSFVLAQLAIILAGALDLLWLETFLRYAWLGFCAYTWFAPELFKKLLARDLGRVELDPNF